jgi:hypothetical protein
MKFLEERDSCRRLSLGVVINFRAAAILSHEQPKLNVERKKLMQLWRIPAAE